MTEANSTILNKWKSKAEELRLQLHLGSKEAASKFEEAKGNIETWAEETGSKLSEMSSEKSHELKIKLEELRVQAALGKAESKEKLAEQQKKISEAMHNVSVEASAIAKDTEDEATRLAHQASEKLDDWQTQLDLLKVQAHLGTKEASDQWEARKSEIKSALNSLEDKIAKAKEEGSDNWDHFSKEIKSSWSHLKDAFKVKH